MSGFLGRPFTGQNVAPMSTAGLQQAYAAAQQRAALQQAYIQQMQAAYAKQQQAMLQASSVQGPLTQTTQGVLPSQAPLPGADPVQGGGAPVLSQNTPQQGAPFSQQGVPGNQPKRFSGTIGGQNAPGGANPFKITPGGGNNSMMQGAVQSAIAQQNNPYANPFVTKTTSTTTTTPTGNQQADIQNLIAQMQSIGGMG